MQFKIIIVKIIFIYFTSVYGQTLISKFLGVDTVNIDQSVSVPTQGYPQEIAIHGWMKINQLSGFAFSGDDIMLVFKLSPNVKSQQIKQPDTLPSVLLSLFISFQNFHYVFSFVSYFNDSMKKITFYVDYNQVNQWIFFYNGHSFKDFKFLGFIHVSEETEKRVMKVEEFTFRTNSRDYSIVAGVYKEDQRYFFHGEIAMLTMNLGDHAIKGMDDIQELYSIQPNVLLTCGAGFAECGFTGKAIDFCQDQDKRDQLVLKSIILLNQQEINACVEIRGLIKPVKISTSIECLKDDNFERLLESNELSLRQDQDLEDLCKNHKTKEGG